MLGTALLCGPLPGLQACAVCFGKAEDPLMQGASLGIMTLLGVVVAVLISVAAFFVVLSRRSRSVNATAELDYSRSQPMELYHD